MTGQVKEEVLTRWGELGISIQNGQLTCNPVLLKKTEFFADGHLEFTYCGVPVVYRLTDASEGSIKIHRAVPVPSTADVIEYKGLTLDRDNSQRLFNRDGSIGQIEVFIPRSRLV